jgi:hypothetical protein
VAFAFFPGIPLRNLGDLCGFAAIFGSEILTRKSTVHPIADI